MMKRKMAGRIPNKTQSYTLILTSSKQADTAQNKNIPQKPLVYAIKTLQVQVGAGRTLLPNITYESASRAAVPGSNFEVWVNKTYTRAPQRGVT